MKQLKQFIAAFLCVATMVAATGCGNAEQSETTTVATTVTEKYEKLESEDLGHSTGVFTSGDFEVKVYGNRAAIGSYLGEKTNVKIPSSIDDHKIAVIDLTAFECSDVEKIEIPKGVTLIRELAFSDCESLKEVVFPSSLQVMESWIFENCISLISVNLKDTELSSMGEYVFAGCTSLKKVELPDTLKTITCQTFEDCTSLESVSLPKKLKTIEGYAFGNCSSLKTIKIPETVTTIESCAFSGCTALESIVIPKGVKIIGSYTFEKCESLEWIEIPDSVKEISYIAFVDANPDMTIKCHKGSAADKFASENEFKVEYIG